MVAMRLLTAILCFVAAADYGWSQENADEKVVETEFKLHPVACGSGKVRVQVEFKNPLPKPIEIYGSTHSGGQSRVHNRKVEDTGKFTFEIEVPTSQQIYRSSVTLLGWPVDEALPKGGKYLPLGKFSFILPVVSHCDVVDTKREAGEFDFFLINRGAVDWVEVQLEADKEGMTFGVEPIKELPKSVADKFPALSRQFYGVKISPRANAKQQLAIRVYSKLPSGVEAYQLVGEKTLVYNHTSKRAPK